MSEANTPTVPVLMSKNNPNGWKLENLLAQLAGEIEAKTTAIEADCSSVAIAVRSNNHCIVELLKEAEGLQRDSYRKLAKVGPDQGPLGKPRIGE